MTANVAGVVTHADVRAAQTLLDALDGLDAEALDLERRGVIAGHLADVRTAGYLEGMQAGRRELARMVQDLLQDEGLAP